MRCGGCAVKRLKGTSALRDSDVDGSEAGRIEVRSVRWSEGID